MMFARHFALALALAAALGLPVVRASAKDLAPLAPAKTCAELKAMDFSRDPAASFRLDSAEEIADGAKKFCLVKGYLQPQVNFQVRLPLDGWSERYLQLGCGGYCGGVNLAAPSAFRQSAGCAFVQDQTLVIASSDLGHRRSETFFADGLWAIGNPAAVVEFAYSANHKTALAAKILIAAFYGQGPRYSYFNGCSDGGRQGLQEAQRFPEDFDGVVAGSTTLDVTATNTFWHAWNVRSNTSADGTAILKASRIPVLHNAVMKACADADGFIVDPRLCAFDVASIVCAADRAGADCLTPAEAEAARKIWNGPTDETGAHLFPGGTPKGSELGWIGSMVPKEDSAPLSLATSGDYTFSWDFPQFMSAFGEITHIDNRNIAFTRAEFERLTQLSTLYDPTDPDLTRFAGRGGKLIMWHGWADTGSAPLGSLNYAEAVRGKLGEKAASDMLSLYLVPGAYHCSGGPTPVSADYLSELIAWVEDGRAPGPVKVAYEEGPNSAKVIRTLEVKPYYEIEPRPATSNVTEWRGLGAYRAGVASWCDWKGAAMECRAR
jgi:Tannase and feruloyl esterase